MSVGYAKSSGLGLYTAQGITSLPTGVPTDSASDNRLIRGNILLRRRGRHAHPRAHLQRQLCRLASNTLNSSVASNNHTQEANAYLEYKVRKIFFTAGYSRLLQGFSATHDSRPGEYLLLRVIEMV